MASSQSIDYGWFFLRLCMGLVFIQLGMNHFSSRSINWFAVVALICGVSLILGLLVRPATLLLLAFMVGLFVSGTRIELRLVRESLTELLALIGFLIGGGGTFLALGAALNGLKGKWYQ